MDKLQVVINHIEMARVTGVPLDFLLTRGQQIKVISMLYRKCRPLGLLVPTLQRSSSGGGGGGEDETYEGATVIDPVKGFYDEPIASEWAVGTSCMCVLAPVMAPLLHCFPPRESPPAALDFASLYPSIMMAHNLCYSTLADPDEVKSGALTPEAIEKTPDENIYFVRAGCVADLTQQLLQQGVLHRLCCAGRRRDHTHSMSACATSAGSRRACCR